MGKISLSLILPLYNEEKVLYQSFEKLLSLKEELRNSRPELTLDFIFVNNKSTDSSSVILENIQSQYSFVKVITLSEKGKGLAIKTGFYYSDSEIIGFSDVDLASDINFLNPMIDKIISGYDMVYGNRNNNEYKIERRILRTVTSKCYTIIFNIYLKTSFKDISCGLKLYRRSSILDILPQVRNKGFFFDSELSYLIYLKNLRVIDQPLPWAEGSDSKVSVFKVSLNYIKELYRVKKIRRDQPVL